MGTRSPSSPDDAADKDAKRKPTTVRSLKDGELPSLKRSRYDDDDTASDEDRRKHRSRRGDYRNEDRRTHRKGDFSPSPERRPRNRNGAGQDSRSEKHREIRRDRISRNSPPENRRDTRRERASPHRRRRGSDDSDGQSPSRYGRKGGHADRVSAKNNEHASSPDRKLGNLNVEIETRGLNLPDDTADKGMKRKSSNLKNPSDGELPSLKKSRYDEDETTSDEDGRKRRSQRRDYHDKDQRNPREDDFSPFLERKSRDHNGARQEGRAGDKVSTKRIELASSPDRKHGDVDEDNEKWESGVHRDQPKHEAKMVADQKRDRSPSLERIGRRDDRRREYSSSPVRTHRRDDRLPSPSRKRRESRSPLHHRDRGKYDGDRNLDRKKRNFSRDEDRVALRDAQASDQDDRAWGRNGKVHGNDDRSKDADRNAGVHVIDRDRGRVNPDRLAGEKDTKMDERDDDVLDRYVGDGMHDKNDLQRQKQGRASQRQRNEEVHDSADEDRRKDRSRRSEDDNDNQRSRRSRGGDRQNKHMTWADKVDEDELAGKDRRDSVELKKHVKHAKILHHKKELHSAGKETKDPKSNIPAANANAEQLQGRSGGVYIPPFKLAQMMKEIQDKSGVEYQRMTWDALRKSINGLVNKVNASNIKNIIPELLAENLIRGRGLFARSCMKSQMASPLFTHVFAALVAVVNTKFPELGELLLKRVILQFRRALRRNDKPLLLAAARFIAHLVNQQVAHEVVALEVLMVLLENPTDDSVEVSVGFVKECGAILQDLAPQGLHGIFERFRGILHEGEIDKRVQFMIEGLFAIRKSGFQGHPAVIPELDLVEQEDQFTHEISLSEDLDAEMSLDIFQADPNFLENEKKYEGIKRDILGEESSDDNGEKGSGESSDDEDDDDDEDEEAEFQKMQIKDETETNLVNLRRTIYLTIMSSVDFEEAGHKLLKIKLESGQEMELNIMLLECCSQERTYLRYYGLLGQRFCMINKIYQENFDTCFVNQYSMIHRLETNKLRNVAKFFAHLLGTDALPWNVLEYIKLTEEDTTSSSRIFIKILFQELSEHLGLRKLNEKLNDSDNQGWINGIFPIDNPKNTRFAINFFTSIGLGGITDNLREHLKKMPRLIMQQQRQVASESDSSDSDDTSESESSSSESDSESSSSGSESESESESKSDSDSRKKRKRR